MAAVGLAGSAGAATTVGQTPAAEFVDCSGFDHIQTAVVAGTSYTVPAAGVITTWSTTGAGTLALKVFRPTAAPDEYLVVGKTAFENPDAAGTLKTFSARMPVEAGDVLGARTEEGACSVIGEGDDLQRNSTADTAVGQIGDYSNQFGGNRLSMSAQVEADADGDGYGDETQDLCPWNATTHRACPTTDPGPGPGPVPLPEPLRDTTKPVISALRFSSSVFRAAKRGPSAKAAKKRKVGTKVSFRLSEVASVKFTVQRRTRGRNVRVRWVRLKASFRVNGERGRNSLTFRGAIRGKRLRPGRYRLNGRAVDAAKNRSRVARKRFKIVGRRPTDRGGNRGPVARPTLG